MLPDDELFGAALDLPRLERAIYLARACDTDTAQRSRIDALLAAYDEADGFLETTSTPRAELELEKKAGDTIGRYSLIRKIGEGGCGIVYLAEQKEPVRRRVALKVIKLGMDTRHVILRFEAERQALALMEHPHIARVFDAGATDTGRPYFVMEFVEGVPLTQYCDEQTLTLADRLELFAQVCAAVQHAHQKGIIHRDLKPSNILVAARDGSAVPTIIDFGIAKATQGQLTEQTLFTRLDQFMGTPTYMSPEQAELREVDIDTRSDLYSLGVVLYELLTGHTPVDPAKVRQSGIDELRRIVREIDPSRPSSRVSALAPDARLALAQLRRTTPAHLIAALRRDLDWIVMRCLEKERSRRYDTAQDLAKDIRRHLRGEPVHARPPQTLYTAQKFVARHRWACAAVAAIAVSLLAGTVISLRQAVRATRAERQAVIERDTATAANRAEALARGDAQRRQEQAEDILTFLLGDFRTELKKAGRLHLLDAVGEKALAYFNSLDARDLTDTALARQAKALTQIGEIRVDEARYPEAETAFKSAYERAAALASRYPKNGDMLFERAQAEFWIGFVHRTRGEFPAAREWLVRYRDSAAALVEIEGSKLRAQRELASGYHNLAVLDLDRGNLEAGRAGLLAELSTVEKLRAAAPDDLTLWFNATDIHGWLGVAAERNGQYTQAIDRYTVQTSELEALVQRDPHTAHWQLGLALSLTLNASVLARTGQRTVATVMLDRARALIDGLVAQDSKNLQWLVEAMNIRLEQAALYLSVQQVIPASLLIEEVREQLVRPTTTVDSPDSRIAGHLAKVWRLEARVRYINRQPNVIEALQRALQLGELIIKEARPEDRVLGEFAQTCLVAGQLASDQGQQADALHHWNRAIEALSPRLLNCNDWRLLDPAARAFACVHRYSESQAIIAQLDRLGYRPLEAWPGPKPSISSVNSTAPNK